MNFSASGTLGALLYLFESICIYLARLSANFSSYLHECLFEIYSRLQRYDKALCDLKHSLSLSFVLVILPSFGKADEAEYQSIIGPICHHQSLLERVEPLDRDTLMAMPFGNGMAMKDHIDIFMIQAPRKVIEDGHVPGLNSRPELKEQILKMYLP